MIIPVITTSWSATEGVLLVDNRRFDCTLGRNGLVFPNEKKEGDGKTPIGTYPLRQLLYRADRVAKPETRLPVEILTPDTGWCEDPSSPDYNKKITLPHPSVHDKMTRDDDLYNYVAVIGFNDDPVMAGKGSAIFMHLARPDFTPTAGCIGLRPEDMLDVLKYCEPSSQIEIRMPV